VNRNSGVHQNSASSLKKKESYGTISFRAIELIRVKFLLGGSRPLAIPLGNLKYSRETVKIPRRDNNDE
jgi:hypothetical protein